MEFLLEVPQFYIVIQCLKWEMNHQNLCSTLEEARFGERVNVLILYHMVKYSTFLNHKNDYKVNTDI